VTFTGFVNKLTQMSKGTEKSFLKDLENIHDDWHRRGRSFEGDPIGFLSFHREIIGHYKKVLRKEGKKLPKPFGKSQLMHPYHDWIDGLNNPESFSNAIEDWHNSLHRDHPDPKFMDPKKNIYMPDFWKLQ